MTRRFAVEIIVDVEGDEPRCLGILEHKARILRMSEDTRMAATAAKWERAIHQAIEGILKQLKETVKA